MQAVLNRLYSRRVDSPTVGDVDEVVRQFVGGSDYDYRALVEALPEASVCLLRAIAAEGVAREGTSASFVVRHGLKAPSTTLEALDRLVRKELVYKTDTSSMIFFSAFGCGPCRQRERSVRGVLPLYVISEVKYSAEHL